MIGSERRRFTLLDALVLIAATAGGFAIIRFSQESSFPGELVMPPLERFLFEAGWTFDYRIPPVLVCLSLATALCALRSPQSLRKPLIRSPGVIACLLVVLVVVMETGRNFITHLVRHRQDPFLEMATVNWAYVSRQAVLVAWIAVRLSGRWRPVRGWPDRLGRWIGWTWLIMWVLADVTSTIFSLKE
jgi:hypothetical protein